MKPSRGWVAISLLLVSLASGCARSGSDSTPVPFRLLEDERGRSSLEDVERLAGEGAFRRPADAVVNLGLTSSAWWLRLDLPRELLSSEGPWLLELAWPLVDEATLYSTRPDGRVGVQRAGRRVPIAEWPLAYRLPTFRVEPGAATYYLRVESAESLILPLSLWTEPAFTSARIREAGLLGVYFGMLFVMTASGLLVFAFLRDVGFLSYAVLVGTFTLWQASFEGLLSTHLWPDAWWWTARAVHVFGILCVSSGLVFAMTFLSTAKHVPQLDRVGRTGLPLLAVLLAWALVAPGARFVQSATLVAMLVGVWVIVAGLAVARQGYRSARYFLASWSLAVIAALIQALRDLGMLPSNAFTGYGMQVGIALTFVTLALGLIDRIFEVREDLDRTADDVRRLEREDAAKRTFLATASHDLRQPLHAVGLFLGALRDRLAGTPSLALVEKIQLATDEMADMFNGLLDLSRLDAGMVEVDVGVVDLDPLLERLENEFVVLARRKAVGFSVRRAGGTVRTDPVLLSRILRNLLSNALRYTEAGEIRLEAWARDAAVEIVVTDTGPGIETARQHEAFEPYRRLEGARDSAPAGIGLGLSIVRRLVDLLGHELRFESEPGRGTTFSVVVPRVAEESGGGTAPTPGGRVDMLDGVTVLVVDDDAAVRDGMREQLRAWGCEVRVAASRDEACALDGPVPDVVLADQHVGTGATGVEIVAAVRRARGIEIPAVIVTGDTSGVAANAAEEAGLPILFKPVLPGRLRTVLNRLVRQFRRTRSPD